jgi:UDP:flavonoid glycosyltransferase YjiC (YdhE family)
MLLATWDGAGNFPPMRALTRALIARGHEVIVMTHAPRREEVLADGARFEPYATAPHVDATSPGIDEVLVEHVVMPPAVAADLTAAIRRLRPDVVLADAMMVTALEAAQASGLPTVSLCHSLLSLLDAPPFAALKPPNARADLLLEFSYRAFEPQVAPGPNVRYVGPLRPDETAAIWSRKLAHRPLVVVGLSTSYQDQAALLQKLCDALGRLPVEGLVATGRAFDPQSVRAPSNVTVARHVPHEAVLGQADLLVTHAGHGTVMAGATFGVPMLCLPMGRDQPFVAAQAAELGLAHVADPGASVDELEAAIAAALADASLRDAASAFARTVEGQADADHAARLVEELVPVAACAG